MSYRIFTTLLLTAVSLTIFSFSISIYTKLISWFIAGVVCAFCALVLYICRVWFNENELEEYVMITLGDYVYLEDKEKVVYIKDYADLEDINAYEHRLATKEEIEVYIRNN
jgi:hypothetical protein